MNFLIPVQIFPAYLGSLVKGGAHFQMEKCKIAISKGVTFSQYQRGMHLVDVVFLKKAFQHSNPNLPNWKLLKG